MSPFRFSMSPRGPGLGREEEVPWEQGRVRLRNIPSAALFEMPVNGEEGFS
jgi:hypothetical protein